MTELQIISDMLRFAIDSVGPIFRLAYDAAALLLFLYGFTWLADAVKTMQRANAEYTRFVVAETALGVAWQLMAAIIWWAT